MKSKKYEFQKENKAIKNNSKIEFFFMASMISIIILSCKNTTQLETENLKGLKYNGVATKEFSKARMDSTNQYTIYRAEMDNRLIENDKNIALIRLEIKNRKVSIKTVQLEKTLDDLIAKNETFRVAIKNEKDGVYSKWEIFKTGLNLNMDILGNSISKMADNK